MPWSIALLPMSFQKHETALKELSGLYEWMQMIYEPEVQDDKRKFTEVFLRVSKVIILKAG